ncbi:hypothetical protein [Loigolactobacillus backii]|uniref:hypothetical protein n=1 Tax=Loigolactobacillus backii TaxID=375175 RepID=UPI000AE8FB64|nr:hypothetical protein [Loigolactobacillus backii]
MINHNKPYGVYGTLHQFDTYELINVLIDSRVRLRALQNYTDELKTLCYQGSKDNIASKLKEYTPIMKLLNSDIDKSLDASIYYLSNVNH